MKSIVAILLTLAISLSLSAIETEDTFDEWDMVIKGCIELMIEMDSVGLENLRITRKARRGVELTCQEKVILILETRKFARELVEKMEKSERGKLKPKELAESKVTVAWGAVKFDKRLEELSNIEGSVKTRKEKAEQRVYYLKLTNALKLLFPECYE